MGSRKFWRLRPRGPALVEESLIRELGLHPVAARVAAGRGLSPAEAEQFFDPPRLPTGDPLLLPDMERAVQTIRRAVAENRRILVYGDYDVDGVTATAIMLEALQKLGASPSYYIPSRVDEGYGLHPGSIESAAADGVGLVVTVDTGTSAVDEVELARRLGMEVVITDHHQVGPEIPRAMAVVNPHRQDSRYPFSQLAGVGVALRVAECLLGDDGPTFARSRLDLAALGTVADVLPLTGENRRLVFMGIEQMNDSPRPGITALMEAAGREGLISAWDLGFVLAPRLNAVGRLGDASAAVELLTTRDSGRARELARQMEDENRARRSLEEEILSAAREVVALNGSGDDPVLVVHGPDWHPGVVGLVASRMMDHYGRPALVLTLDGDVLRGSGRSVTDFNLYEALARCGDLLGNWGGHEAAAGLELEPDNLEEFRRRLMDVARESMPDGGWRRHLVVDAWVDVGEIDLGLAESLARFEPCGPGNPEPLLGMGGRLAWLRRVGKDGRHLLLGLEGSGGAVEGVGFGLGDLQPGFDRGAGVAVAARASADSWRGEKRARLRILDVKEDGGQHRQHLAALYLALRDAVGDGTGPVARCDPSLMAAMRQRGLDPDAQGALDGVDVLTDLGLVITMKKGGAPCWLLTPPPAEKMDLYQSPAFVRLAFGE